MYSSLKSLRSGFIIAGLAITLITLPGRLFAQSPLTVQPSTGRVGVGTTTPSEALEVNGAVKATSFKGDGSQLTNLSGGGQWTSSGSNIYYNTGNIGIGTSSPGQKLDVGNGQFHLGDRGDGCCAGFLMSSGGQESHLYSYGNGTFTIHKYGPGSAQGQVFTILPNGNLGIGTASPSVKLEVGGGGVQIDDRGDGCCAQFVEYINGYSTHFYTYADGTLQIHKYGPGSPNGAVLTIANDGSVNVTGALSAAEKNFQIDHPLGPNQKFLIHSSLEGPEVAVYYRGQAQLVNGETTVVLPNYFEALTRKEQRTVQLTPIDDWSPLYVSGGIVGGNFKVRTASGGNLSQRFYWEIKAVRADVPVLAVEKLKEPLPSYRTR